MIDERPVGAALNRDISVGEKVEAEHDAFISRRDRDRRKLEGERESEEAWKRSERRRDAARDARLREEWSLFHQDQAERLRANLEALIAHHEVEAEKCLQKGA